MGGHDQRAKGTWWSRVPTQAVQCTFRPLSTFAPSPLDA